MERCEIQHDSDKREFFTLVDGEKAYVAYCMLDAGTVDFYRTFVPDPARGSGIAHALANSALDFASNQGWRVIPSCWYVAMIAKRRTQEG